MLLSQRHYARPHICIQTYVTVIYLWKFATSISSSLVMDTGTTVSEGYCKGCLSSVVKEVQGYEIPLKNSSKNISNYYCSPNNKTNTIIIISYCHILIMEYHHHHHHHWCQIIYIPSQVILQFSDGKSFNLSNSTGIARKLLRLKAIKKSAFLRNLQNKVGIFWDNCLHPLTDVFLFLAINNDPGKVPNKY